MKRSDAESLIERIRVAAADVADPAHLIRQIQNILATSGIPPLTPCDGEAHSNPFIDNCTICAPRWGWVGERIKVT